MGENRKADQGYSGTGYRNRISKCQLIVDIKIISGETNNALIHKKKNHTEILQETVTRILFLRKGMASLTIEEENIGNQGETHNKQPHVNWSDEYQTPQGRHNEDQETIRQN